MVDFEIKEEMYATSNEDLSSRRNLIRPDGSLPDLLSRGQTLEPLGEVTSMVKEEDQIKMSN